MGVGFNEPATNLAWSEKEKFPYEVWQDTNRTLALTYGAVTTPDAARPKRITVVLDPEGKLVLHYPEVGVGTHPADVLADMEAIFPR